MMKPFQTEQPSGMDSSPCAFDTPDFEALETRGDVENGLFYMSFGKNTIQNWIWSRWMKISPPPELLKNHDF